MKNLINYFYHIYPDQIFENKGIFYFFVDDVKYYFIVFNREINDLNFLVELTNNLYNMNVKVHTFIKNINEKFYTTYNQKNYVLLRVNKLENENIDLEDIVKFNKLIYSNSETILYKENWHDRWCSQIDTLEKQINEYNKEYKEIVEYFDYYIGLAENAISYIDYEREKTDFDMKICHQKITSPITYGMLYNPLNFLFDNEMRDIAEYVKTSFFNNTFEMEELENFIIKSHPLDKNIKLLYARLLYPTYYFDLMRDAIDGNFNLKKVKSILNKSEQYENLLSDIYNFLKTHYNLEKVEWIDRIK